MRDFTTVQEKILDRALYLIGMRGNYDVPIRDITKAAGVNVNAINYYFGNKDNMLHEVNEFFIQNYLSAYSILDTEEPSDRRLALWANEVMEYTLQYPGIQILQRHALQSSGFNKMKDFLLCDAQQYEQKVLFVLQDVFHVKGDSAELVRCMLYSAVIHPVSLGTNFCFDTGQMANREFRLNYIQFVIDTLKKGTIIHEV